jgi:cyclopropane fatty-acyl-phospholipid synthase-like methyltransferase
MNAKIIALRERPGYELDGLANEIGRLRLRANVLTDLSQDALRQAGIERGMRVADLGCGIGDASLQIAEAVGPSGLVVGVDPSEEDIQLAERRATVAGQCYWTRFISADLDEFVPAGQFDAVAFHPMRERPGAPVATFRRRAALIRHGGIALMIAC